MQQPRHLQVFTEKVVSPNPATTPLTKNILNGRFIEQAISKMDQPMVLDEDAKSSVLFYMERFVEKLLKETAEATKLRDSKIIKAKDVEFALQTKFNGGSSSFD